jgi:hypothetical protein
MTDTMNFDDVIFEALTKRADQHFYGDLTIMRMGNVWKIGFFDLDPSNADKLCEGKTFREAAISALSKSNKYHWAAGSGLSEADFEDEHEFWSCLPSVGSDDEEIPA